MTDIFNEVDEEMRRERLKRLWDRYGTYLIALCVLVVVGVGVWRGYEWWQNKQAEKSGAVFEQAVELAEAGKHQQAEAAFAKLATDGTAGYRSLARLRGAAELAPTDRAAAVKAYDAIAADTSQTQVMRDLAAVRAGYLLVDSASYSELLSKLEPLTAPDRTFRYTAQEILALSAWKAGDTIATRKWTDMIMADPSAPAGTRSRAQVLSELIAAGNKG